MNLALDKSGHKKDLEKPKRHYCEKCDKDDHCNKCCYKSRDYDRHVKCGICKRRGHTDGCCHIIWNKQKEKEKRKMKVDFRGDSDESDDNMETDMNVEMNEKLRKAREANEELMRKDLER